MIHKNKLFKKQIKKFYLITGVMICSLLFAFPTLSFGKDESDIVIFVSSSMPDEAIGSIQCQAEVIEAPVILRGLIDNSLKKTVQWSEKWITKGTDESRRKKSFQINPVLFRKYQITQVPAILVKSGDAYAVVYGNVTLDYALRYISENHQYNPSVSAVAEKALARFKHSRGAVC